jgi:hypothetical protein
MSNNLFLLDPNIGYPFALVSTGADTTTVTKAIAMACAWHFEKPVRHVSTLYLELHNTLKIVFRDGTDVFIDVAFNEPEDDSQQQAF